MLTIFTATYNRKDLISRLYESLLRQTCKNFEWLIVDDGSVDGTDYIINEWITQNLPFKIRYYKTENKGKISAMNLGIEKAHGVYFASVDSDDLLTDDAVEKIFSWFSTTADTKLIAGVAGLMMKPDGCLLSENINFYGKKYLDITNLQRSKYGLNVDTFLVFYTSIIRKYRFPLWKNERYAPESLVLNQMAIDGLYLRFFNYPIYVVDYQTSGMSASSSKIVKENPMGFALMYNHILTYPSITIKEKCYNTIQFIVLCLYSREYFYLFKCNNLFLFFVLFPFGLVLFFRRRRQFDKIKQ